MWPRSPWPCWSSRSRARRSRPPPGWRARRHGARPPRRSRRLAGQHRTDRTACRGQRGDDRSRSPVTRETTCCSGSCRPRDAGSPTTGLAIRLAIYCAVDGRTRPHTPDARTDVTDAPTFAADADDRWLGFGGYGGACTFVRSNVTPGCSRRGPRQGARAALASMASELSHRTECVWACRGG